MRSFLRGLPKNIDLIEKTIRDKKNPEWFNPVKNAVAISQAFRAFHWELEFPEAFSKGKPLFDLVLANPPWNEIRPYDEDFFSGYMPSFRILPTKTEKDQEKKTLLKDDSIPESIRILRG